MLVATIFLVVHETMEAQTVTDDFKKQLKQNIRKEIEFENQLKYKIIAPVRNKEDQILSVSPNTKLPGRYDKFFDIPPMLISNISMVVTNSKKNILGENDYTVGKVLEVPNSQSIMQSAHYTKGTGASIEVGDIDPVRAYQRYKARKRKAKVNRIKRAYGQE